MFPLVLLLAIVLGATSMDGYLGAEFCRPCHTSIYQIWKRGPHARSLDELTPSARSDYRCVGCHSMGQRTGLRGVQCESCHGPGRHYAASYLMRDPMVARALGLVEPGEAVCRRCHTADTPSLAPFDYDALLPLVDHRGAR